MGILRTRRGRVHVFVGVLSAFTAIVNWWLVIDEGPSDARVITAVVATLVAIGEIVWRVRARIRARSARADSGHDPL